MVFESTPPLCVLDPAFRLDSFKGEADHTISSVLELRHHIQLLLVVHEFAASVGRCVSPCGNCFFLFPDIPAVRTLHEEGLRPDGSKLLATCAYANVLSELSVSVRRTPQENLLTCCAAFLLSVSTSASALCRHECTTH